MTAATLVEAANVSLVVVAVTVSVSASEDEHGILVVVHSSLATGGAVQWAIGVLTFFLSTQPKAK